jgi:SCF-associated factor 1
MGHADTTPTTLPNIMPELQHKSIISVVLGDYHYGALTSFGALYTWGAYAKGALGLGDPTVLDPGLPGGFTTEDQRFRAAQYHFGTPQDVRVPTQVRFDHGMKKQTKRFCFAAAAAGWHLGALVIDLEHVPENTRQEFEEESTTIPQDVGTFRGRGRIFRIGHAGRGLPRGRGGF